MTTYFSLLPYLRMSGSIAPVLHTSSWRARGNFAFSLRLKRDHTCCNVNVQDDWLLLKVILRAREYLGPSISELGDGGGDV